MRTSPFVAFWALLLLPVQAYQVDSVDLHGSLSQSYLKTHGHEWLIPKSLDGSFEFTELSLNLHKQFERWNFGAQAISRDFGREGDFEVRLDWGHLEFNAMDALSLRLGRVKMPIGFYAEYRDVDVARTEILLPQTFLPEDYRGAAVAYDGIGLAGDLPLSDSHLLQYHLFWGTNNIKDDFFFFFLTQSLYESSTAIPGLGLPGLSQEQAHLNSKSLRGGQLIWTYEPWLWRLGYNFIHYLGHYELRFYDQLGFGGVGTPSILSEKSGLELDIQWHVLSTDLTWKEWLFRAETLLRINDYTHGPLFMSRFAQPLGSNDPLANGDELWSWYLSAQRQLNEQSSAFLSFGRFLLTEQRPTLVGSTKLNELSAGLRYDFNDHLLGKLQVFHYWDRRGTLDESTNLDESWGMVLARLTAHF